MPLATCGVVLVNSAAGERFLLYTVRGNANETYKGYFHMVGSMPPLAEPQRYNSSEKWVQDAVKEAPFRADEVRVLGVLGIVEDTYFRHAEVCHLAEITKPIEEIVRFGEGRAVRPAHGRETDRQVEFRVIPWQPDTVAKLVLETVPSIAIHVLVKHRSGEFTVSRQVFIWRRVVYRCPDAIQGAALRGTPLAHTGLGLGFQDRPEILAPLPHESRV